MHLCASWGMGWGGGSRFLCAGLRMGGGGTVCMFAGVCEWGCVEVKCVIKMCAPVHLPGV